MTKYSFAELEGIWENAGGSLLAAPMAAAIAMAESGGDSNSTNNNGNGTQDRGLWQINSIHGSQSTFDVTANARAAVAISSNGTNWRPWCTAWSNGRCGGTFQGSGSPYLKFLPASQVAPVMPTQPSSPTNTASIVGAGVGPLLNSLQGGSSSTGSSSSTGGGSSGTATTTPASSLLGGVTGLDNLSNTIAQIYNGFTKTIWFGAITALGILMIFGGLAIVGYTTRPGQAAVGLAKKVT